MSRPRDATPRGAVEKLVPRRRILLGAFLLAAGLILGRAFQLQALEHEKWAGVAEDQQRARVPLPARRGGIFDRDGVPLALTQQTYQVSVAPRELRDRKAAQRRLVSALGLSQSQARRSTDRKRSWVVLPGRYTEEQRLAFAEVKGVHFQRRLERLYPQGRVGREVIGSVSGDARPLGGIEQQFDALLRGTDGHAIVRRDAAGRKISAFALPSVPPQDGMDIRLTIDLDLQEIADGALRDAVERTGASGGDLLLVDPATGDLLAAVSRRGGASTLAAITEPYEPGSTLKPFLVASLLERERVSLQTVVDAEGGSWRAPGRRNPITDTERHDDLTVSDALRVSSNVVMAKLAARLTPGEQYEYLRDYGFGTPTGVEYPSESSGRLRRPASWSATSSASLAMGYEIAVTPLQLTMAYAALANGGTLIEPRLLREVRSARGEVQYRTEPQPIRRVTTPAVAARLTQVLVSVVEDGTATRASLGSFDVAGKTGTARRTGAGGRYVPGSYTATFVGYFPATDPQITIFVKLDEPRGDYYGGLTAAPVTRETLQAILAARTAALDGVSLLATRAPRREAEAAPARTGGDPLSGDDGTFVFSIDAAHAPAPAPPPVSAIPVTLPTVEGLPMRAAARRMHALGLSVRLEGSGAAARTVPAAGAEVSRGDTIRIVGGR